MRFPLAARRIILAPALVLALALAVTACSSSSSSASSSASSSPATATSAPAGSPSAVTVTSPATGSAAAATQITANWEKFFNSSTSLSERVALLQNGSTFSSAISDFSKLPLASGIGAKVTGVTVNSATSATVTYNLVSGSTTLLGGQKGTAVYQDGTWKVGDASLCGLFQLVPGGSVPAACKTAG
jgi:purine-cytosine permease-like protein